MLKEEPVSLTKLSRTDFKCPPAQKNVNNLVPCRTASSQSLQMDMRERMETPTHSPVCVGGNSAVFALGSGSSSTSLSASKCDQDHYNTNVNIINNGKVPNSLTPSGCSNTLLGSMDELLFLPPVTPKTRSSEAFLSPSPPLLSPQINHLNSADNNHGSDTISHANKVNKIEKNTCDKKVSNDLIREIAANENMHDKPNREISKQLRTRLNFALMNLQNGWIDKSFPELEKEPIRDSRKHRHDDVDSDCSDSSDDCGSIVPNIGDASHHTLKPLAKRSNRSKTKELPLSNKYLNSATPISASPMATPSQATSSSLFFKNTMINSNDSL